MTVYSEYTWVFVLAIFVGFIAAFGIGANDLANSFGSSVGTKALRMWQAVIVAAVCEFSGAFFLGASVTDTIKSGITDVSNFANMPDVFLFGMFCVMLAAAFWDNCACHLELPVSTTHTTVGAILGFTLVAGGPSAVIWAEPKATFPYFRGFAAIVCSWIISPLAAFIAVGIIYTLLRQFVLRSRHSFSITFWIMPLLVGATFGLIAGFVTQTGAKNGIWAVVSDGMVAVISCSVALGTALLTLLLVMPWLRYKTIRDERRVTERLSLLMGQPASHIAADTDDKTLLPQDSEDQTTQSGKTIDLPPSNEVTTFDLGAIDPALVAQVMYELDAEGESDSAWVQKVAGWYHRVSDSRAGKAVFQNRVARALRHSLFYDVHEVVEADPEVAAVWRNAEVFDFKTERLFRYLQVFSAMAMSFAHGSNDVANAMGPFSSVYYTWQNSEVPQRTTPVPEWVLAVGGAGIVCGLATYGYKIMRVLGVKAVKLTNARGFVAEWCTALVVVVASRFGLPISTTQVVCGAILSIGVFEGRKGVNWPLTIKMFGGWIITILVAASVAAFFTAVSIFSPNKNSTLDIYNSSNTINLQTLLQLLQMNSSALSSNNAELMSQVAQLNATLTLLWSTAVRDIQATANLQNSSFTLFNSTECLSNL